MNTFNDLVSFIDLAEKNRKYPENTAHGLRAALKVFGRELKPDEFNSIALIEERMDEIFLDVLDANKDNYSIESLNTYKARFLKALGDYKRYGQNPSNLANWTIKPRQPRPHAQASQSIHIPEPSPTPEQDTRYIPDTIKDTSAKEPSKVIPQFKEGVEKAEHKIELALRQGAKAQLILPADLTKAEAQMIKNILDSLTA